MPKFGASTYCLTSKINSGKYSPVQAFERLCDLGAQVVEICPIGFDTFEDPALCEAFAKASRERGIPLGNYSTGSNFILLTAEQFDANIAKAKKHIDAAASMGIRTIRFDCAYANRPISENTPERFDEELPDIVRGYRLLCDYAKQSGMTVQIENHGYHANGAERVRRIITAVGRDNFGHQLDVGNYICVDDVPEMSVRRMIGFATTIHMKDFYVRSGNRFIEASDGGHCIWFGTSGGRRLRGSILGQGDLDIPDIMKVIKDSGYDGNIMLEFEGVEDCDYATGKSIAYMKQLWDNV